MLTKFVQQLSTNYERSELLIYDGKQNSTQKKGYAKKRPPSPTAVVQLLANHMLKDYCTYSSSHIFWGQRSFQRAIAGSVHAAAMGSA